MGYRLVDGVYQYSESPSKEAVAWQGYDSFPGMDRYEDKVIKAGTVLVKLEPSSSGYFTTLEVYESLKKNGKVSAVELSEGLQVAPWRNPKTDEIVYRSKVSFTILENDIVAAYGEKTLANQEYGEGNFVQIYVAGYDKDAKEKIGLRDHGGEELVDTTISKEQWNEIQTRHTQHLLKRNLFCYLKSRDVLSRIASDTQDVAIREFCEKQLQKVDKRINTYIEDIQLSIGTVGRIHAPSYDELNRYLNNKIEDRQVIGSLEKEIDGTFEGLMKKVEGDLDKQDKKSINVDELSFVYQLHCFTKVNKEIGMLEMEKNRKPASMADRMEKFKKLSSLSGLQKDLIRSIGGPGKEVARKLSANLER
ncbi:hypothetical protein [Paenibacillus sp. DYY-L-2]|uniref:hypothetical protein n=1 Tax=Paenibacillus sp. DYY-L-2 TaxID=3447013 RepID=UPI003F4F53DE